MISKLMAGGTIAFGVISFATGVNAGGVDKDGGFYATPIQKGAPRDLPGEQLVPGANIAVDAIDGIVRPLVVEPIHAAGASLAAADAAPGPAPAAAPKARRHHARHHHHKKHK